MKCPFCFTENNRGKLKCDKCGAFLLHGTKVSDNYIDYLIERGIIGSIEDLLQLRDITVSCRCDDGVSLPPGLEIDIELPLYYNESDIIHAVKEKGVCRNIENEYFEIDEFHDRMEGRPEGVGNAVLAEAIADNLMKLQLHLMVSTRQASLSGE